MTHNEREAGKRLTVNNATKAQLQWMVEDREAKIDRLYKELQEKQAMIDALVSAFSKKLEVAHV